MLHDPAFYIDCIEESYSDLRHAVFPVGKTEAARIRAGKRPPKRSATRTVKPIAAKGTAAKGTASKDSAEKARARMNPSKKTGARKTTRKKTGRAVV